MFFMNLVLFDVVHISREAPECNFGDLRSGVLLDLSV